MFLFLKSEKDEKEEILKAFKLFDDDDWAKDSWLLSLLASSSNLAISALNKSYSSSKSFLEFWFEFVDPCAVTSSAPWKLSFVSTP